VRLGNFEWRTRSRASAWGVTSDGRLIRVDQYTGAKTGIEDVTQSAAGLATGFDSVWVTDDLQGTLTRVDPETLEGDAPIPVPGELGAIAVGAGAVWILDTSSGVVIPIDPTASPPTVGSPIRVGAGPTDDRGRDSTPSGWPTTKTARSRGSTP
jgi:hypothetical protein